MTSKVKMIKKLIEDQLRLLEAPFVNDHPDLQEIIHQMIHGSKARKFIKLYQYLMEAFLYTGGLTSQMKAIIENRKTNRALIKSKRPCWQVSVRNSTPFKLFKTAATGRPPELAIILSLSKPAPYPSST